MYFVIYLLRNHTKLKISNLCFINSTQKISEAKMSKIHFIVMSGSVTKMLLVLMSGKISRIEYFPDMSLL